MKRLMMLLCSLMAVLGAWAQMPVFEGTIVDAQTNEPLPFATIYINKERSTIANADGDFVFKADSSDVVRFTYVGYQTKHVPCSQLSIVVQLEPIEQTLKEVVVLPYPLKKFIKAVTKETLRQLQKFKKKKSTFFYRQTAFSDTTCYELVEAFLTGKPAVSLRDLQLTTGRYAGLRPDSVHKYSFYYNFFTFSQVDFASRNTWPEWRDDIVPLFRNYSIYYDVDYEILGDAPDRLIALRFVPKPEVKRAILEATIYVDEQTLRVRKLEGCGRHIAVLHTMKSLGADSVVHNVKNVFRTNFNYVVHMSEERGFEEVQSVYVVERHQLGGLPVTTNSILFNLGEQGPQPQYESDSYAELKFNDNLHRRIEQQEYDSVFWRENEIVRRTPVEHHVIQLFEDKKLFGVWR